MISQQDRAYIGRNFAVPNCHHGPCGPVSLKVQEYLEERGYADVRRVKGRVFPTTDPSTWSSDNRDMLKRESKDGGLSHIWVDIDGQIIDATASQFGAPDLLVLSKSDPEYAWYAYPPDDEDEEPSESFSLFRTDW